MATKTWLITGAASGFGRELTARVLARGDRVGATDINPEPLAELSEQYGAQLWTTALDVTDTPAIRRVVGEAFDRLGRIGVIVSNAGYGQLARAAIPHLREQGGGRIVQMSSSGGRVPDPGMSLYDASKFGIEVTLVDPGGSRTNFSSAIALTESIDAYSDWIVGQVRGVLAGDPDDEFVRKAVIGDPAKVAQAIIDSVDVTPAPKRLTLGSNAYEAITTAWRDRLAALEAQHDLG